MKQTKKALKERLEQYARDDNNLALGLDRFYVTQQDTFGIEIDHNDETPVYQCIERNSRGKVIIVNYYTLTMSLYWYVQMMFKYNTLSELQEIYK